MVYVDRGRGEFSNRYFMPERETSRMLIVGLTGGTGSGKSTAALRFEAHGLAIVDADRTGHALIEPGGRAEADVVRHFGPSILTCGIIDRGKLGALVFADTEALGALNTIMKPLIAESIATKCAAFAEAGKSVAMVDAALLGDSGSLEPWLEDLVLVACPAEMRARRLVESRGLSEAQARQRIAAQVDPELKRPLARWIIENSGSLEALHEQADGVARELLSLAGSSKT